MIIQVQKNIIVEEKWEDCINCNGRGYFTHTCSTCVGKGRLVERPSETSTRICGKYYGIGVVPCCS